VAFDDGLDDRETKTTASSVACTRRVGLVKTIEDAFEVFRPDAFAGI